MANVASTPPTRCLRTSPPLRLRRLRVRTGNGGLLYDVVDLAIAREGAFELRMNGLHLPGQNGLRFRDRAAEVIARRVLDQFRFDRNFLQHIRRGESGWRRRRSRPFVGFPIDREQGVDGTVEV